ncbi:DeoR/GlpR family DNA-binding transcription regulator [Deinococcus pimensis]|uniref:DeoR/GlpR family DNA-binding transcription regulator n=1 Tax=Deinococcus pimensis TaxID=309888 RepID=UPI0004B3D7E4|nr:DeoR/GlpR family DNA-binding transcription regulator [Deinococcus pimensis]
MATNKPTDHVERRQQILLRAHQHGHVKLAHLALELGVHEMTIRRDLDLLQQQGLLERTHGGARLLQKGNFEVSLYLRSVRDTLAKDALARTAASFIQDGDTVALDASSTTLALAKLLGGRDVTVIVSGLVHAELLERQGVPFLLVGGDYHRRAESFVGEAFVEGMRRLHPDVTFFSTRAYGRAHGFVDAHLPDVIAKRAMIRAASRVVVLLDGTKFQPLRLPTVAVLDDVHDLVTDHAPDETLLGDLDQASVTLHRARPTTGPSIPADLQSLR